MGRSLSNHSTIDRRAVGRSRDRVSGTRNEPSSAVTRVSSAARGRVRLPSDRLGIDGAETITLEQWRKQWAEVYGPECASSGGTSRRTGTASGHELPTERAAPSATAAIDTTT